MMRESPSKQIEKTQVGTIAGTEPLAIVGIGCRLPGKVRDVESFWQLLCDGRSGIVEVPADRWSNQRFYHPDPDCLDSMVSKWGGFVEGLDQFDPRFWGISPREAVRMDPQQRWLLQTAWESIEDSGTPPSTLRGKEVGVFVGIAGNDFGGIQLPYHQAVDAYSNSGSTFSIASNRISYLLDLKGPSLSVDTACSSSLVAVWLACENIWSGRCQEALAGGVNALIAPHASIGFSRASMLSRSGQCYAFDARANGYVRGEGAGVVYLKRLDEAQRDGNRIYAVIRGAAANQDGHTSSMTVPGIEGQSEMLRKAYHVAGVDPRRVVYVEAHGTGTPVGDPIELTALGRVLGHGRDSASAIVIGSVKTNIGHLEAGSGIAGLIKAALVLHHGQIPANLNFEQANPNIPFETLGLRVAAKNEQLPRQSDELPVVGVNSFGFGGTNAHVVLEAAPANAIVANRPMTEMADRPILLPISARDDEALRKYAAAFRDCLAKGNVGPRDLATAAGQGKEQHERRLVVRGRNGNELRRRLVGWLSGVQQVKGISQGRANNKLGELTFVYTGQGAQWWGMGQQLQRCEPVFRKTLEEIDALITPLAGWSLLGEMNRSHAESQIDRTDVAQPAIFALQVALTALWAEWGIRPVRMIGHSVGEVAAAYCAGVYKLADAVKVIYHRSRLQHRTGGRGGMFAVGISAEEAWKAIGHRHAELQVAVINNPSLVTISGDRQPLEELAMRFQADNLFLRWLPIDYAFHTHQMEPIHTELLESLRDIQPMSASIPLVSTVTAGEVAGPELDADYWWRNVREPVLFGPAILELLKRHQTSFLELGPHPALASSLRDCGEALGKHPLVFHSLKRETDEQEEIFENLAQLQLAGAELVWSAINQGSGAGVAMPPYPWSNESFWLETEDSRRERLQVPDHPLLGLRSGDAMPCWTVELDLHRLPFLNDHRLWGSVVFPGAGYVEIGLALARLLFPGKQQAVDGLSFHKALFVLPEDPPCIQVIWSPSEHTFSVYSRPRSRKEWELNASGQLRGATKLWPSRLDEANFAAKFTEELSGEQIRIDLAGAGFQFGPNFQLIAHARRGDGGAIGKLELSTAVADTAEDYCLHPAILDACFQLAAYLREKLEQPEENFLLPHSIKRVQVFRERAKGALTAWGRLVVNEPGALEANLWLTDTSGECIVEIQGFRSEMAPQALGRDSVPNSLYYRTVWQARQLPGAAAAGPCTFPDSAALVEAANAIRNELYVTGGLENYTREVAPRLNRLAALFIKEAYIELGWQPSAGEEFTLDQHLVRLGILERHRRLVAAQLKLLKDEGLLQASGPNGWRCLECSESEDARSLLERLRTGGGAEELALLEHCGRNLAAVLCGDLDPVQLLFPAEGSNLVERFYLRAGDFPNNHLMMAEIVRTAVAALPEDRGIRILEVGGGTASLTREILPVLPPDRTEYLFTDIGAAFLASAMSSLERFPFVKYQTFDLEKEPEQQGISAKTFDVVVASNVLHATEDLERTLAHLKQCLVPGGLVLFLETMNRIAYAETMVFGMLEGWWKYQDESRRKDSPLLSQSGWLDLLRSCGFEQVDSCLSVPDPTDILQAIFLAQANSMEAPQKANRAVLKGRKFLLIPDRSGIAKMLTSELEALGASVTWATADLSSAEPSSPDSASAGLAEAKDGETAAWLSAINAEMEVIFACGLDLPDADATMTGERLAQAQVSGVLRLLELLRDAKGPQRFWVLLRNVFVAVEGDRGEGLAGAPMVGLARVVDNEQFPRQVRIVDCGAEPAANAVQLLLQELVTGAPDWEVCYRHGKRWIPQLERVEPGNLPLRQVAAVGSAEVLVPFRLESRGTGILANLEWRETARRRPGPTEIEVEVKAGGINFRDLMKALGTYPGHPVDLHWYGDDFSGVVSAVGTEVTKVRVGDRVAGMAPYAFQSHLLVDARLVFQVPEKMSDAEAATLPTVFLTAHYALRHLARMRPGESILIHGGTGGVGQAAIQIAQQLELEIFATAGTDEKRQLLRDQGVPHVLSSRTLEFADSVREITGGRGVDAVLNSFAGDFIPRSLELLAPYGRFLEIGKIDVYGNSKIGLYQLKDNISYFVIDLGQYVQSKQKQAGELFTEMATEIQAGRYRPLPFRVFPASQCIEAFRWMAQGKHIGKNVLAFDDSDLRVARSSQSRERFRSDGTYLISGGASGFCLEIARTMVAHGARTLVLLSRSGPRDSAAVEVIEAMRRDGAQVVDFRGDVTKTADVEAVVGKIKQELPPLVGVVHGAMVLDDEFLSELTTERFRSVLDVKMLGGWNLHQATRDCPLEDFISFSSFSAVIGAPKQANYNAGNYFLDALTRFRRARGLPALTIDWGALRGAGFVERNQKTAEYLDRVGLEGLPLEDAVRCFREAILFDEPQLGIARVDWNALPTLCPTMNLDSRFKQLMDETRQKGQGGSLNARLRAAAPEQKLGLMTSFIAEQIAGVFGISPDRVELETPLTQMGLDSLMAIELKIRLEKETGVTLPMNEILNGPTLSQLAGSLLRLLEGNDSDAGASDEIRPVEPVRVLTGTSSEVMERIDELSEAEIDRLLSELEAAEQTGATKP
jgi:acyl transferase domain-containing protein/NADPH:quinone reductase-like Zn-dependent oxidoreductase/acyl carrier protein/NADP-dependent 3-hydroxy acid dehydrogenase YdfG/SAM-dependent methyltransferase